MAIIRFIILLFLFSPFLCHAAFKPNFPCTSLTGGTIGALDYYKASRLHEGDATHCTVNNKVYHFVFDYDATDAENTTTHPYKVRPDDYSTQGVWIEFEPEPIVTDTHIFENVFYPDSEASDHGKTDATYVSVKDIVDDIGSTENAVMVFRHDGTGNTTTYTFQTAETISSNFTVIVEPGAVLYDNNTNFDLTIRGHFKAYRFKCFDWAGGGNVYFSEGLTGAQAGRTTTVYPEWWGAIPDSTTANQTFIEAAAESFNGKGGIVQFSRGVYKLTGNITADQDGVTYRGISWDQDIFAADEAATDLDSGTWFWIINTSVSCFGITGKGIRLERFAIGWDQPTPAASWAPTEYDAAITIRGGTNVHIDRILLLNATYGISLGRQDVDDVTAGRISITNVYGNCFKWGISLERVTDFSNFENIHFVHYWSSNSNVIDYMQDNFEMFVIKHADQPQFNNVRGFIGKAGFVFKQHTYGAGAGGVQINNAQFDGWKYGVDVQASATANGFINNFNVNACDANDAPCNSVITDSIGIKDVAGATFKCTNVSISHFGEESFEMTAAGAWSFENVTFNGFNHDNGGHGVTNVTAGTMYIGSNYVITGAQNGASTNPATYSNVYMGHSGWQSWSNSSGSTSSDPVTVASGTADRDMFVHSYLHVDTDTDRGYHRIETPNGTVIVQSSAHFNSAAGGTDVRLDGISAAVKRGETWQVIVQAKSGTILWYVRTIALGH